MSCSVFPYSMMQYFSKNSVSKDYSGLEEFFSEKESDRKTYIAWSLCHLNLLENAEALKKAFDIAQYIVNKRNDSFQIVDKFFNNDAITALCLYNCEVINEQIASEIFLKTDFSDFSKLEHENLFGLFDQKCGNFGESILFHCETFSIVKPFLKSLDSKYFIRVLSLKNNYGNTVLHVPEIFKLSIDLLEKRKSTECKQLLSIKNNEGNTPLHNVSIYELAIPILKKLNTSELLALESLKNNKDISVFLNLYTVKDWATHSKLLLSEIENVVLKREMDNLPDLKSLQNNQNDKNAEIRS